MRDTKVNRHRIKQLLILCADIFDQSERFSLSDSVIFEAIKKFPGNGTIQVVMPKVILINSFYSTQIYDTESIAKHIVRVEADRKLVSGDIALISDISHGHGIKTRKTNKEINFYSFATKYAALHEPTKYPLFDSLVMRLLSVLNKQFKYCPNFTQTDLRNYQNFISVIDALLNFTDLESAKYKRFDQGLWIYAKYLYDQSNLTQNEVELIGANILQNDD